MRAVRVHAAGGPEVLQVEEIDEPAPGPGQVLLQVDAAGVNFVDTYQRSGEYPMRLPTTLGLEGAGTIAAIGEGVTDRAVGERVAWCGALGSYADRVVAPADRTIRVPDDVSTETAAAVLLQGVTAHYLSHSTFSLQPDHTALVYAPAGGVGRLLVQLATRRGARVIACTSSAEKADIATRLGADATIDYRTQDIAATVRDLTDGHGVDVVYDSVGRTTFDASLDSLKQRGLLVLYGAASGPVPPVDPQVLNKKGSLFLTRPGIAAYTSTADELAWRAGAVLDQVANGILEVAIHERYPLAEAARSHTDLESGTTAGKLLLLP